MPSRVPRTSSPSRRRSGRSQTVTIKDVARQAGVSVASVSRVLNEKGPVAEATSRRIREVAERLRYVPHGAARSLITNKTSAIGVLLPDIYGEFFSEVIRGIDLAARRSGYHLLVSGSHGDTDEIEAVLRATRGRVDGLIVMSPEVAVRSLEANLPPSLPIVMLNCRGKGLAFDSITVDNHGGAFEMMRHLASLGHTRIALVMGPARNYDAGERLRGYRDAVRALALERSPQLEIEGDFTERSGHLAGRVALGISPRPTAIFAANDSMAIGVLSALREAAVDVPGGIAVAGFDDLSISRFMSPPLTSVHVAMAELGARGIERLLQAIEAENRHRRRHETMPTNLVVRNSSGGCRAAADVSALQAAGNGHARLPEVSTRDASGRRTARAGRRQIHESNDSKGGRGDATEDR